MAEVTVVKGAKMFTGRIVACGTNWAITPASGVPWPSASVNPFVPLPVGPGGLEKKSSLPNPFVKTSRPGAIRPRNAPLRLSTPVSITATALSWPSYGTPRLRRSLRPMSEPVDEPARLLTVLNCQMPSLSEAYSVVPSAENEMLRDDSMKLCGPWILEVLKPRAKSVTVPGVGSSSSPSFWSMRMIRPPTPPPPVEVPLLKTGTTCPFSLSVTATCPLPWTGNWIGSVGKSGLSSGATGVTLKSTPVPRSATKMLPAKTTGGASAPSASIGNPFEK